MLSSLNYAAKLSGVATEELQGGLIKLIKTQADAAQGGKDSAEVFNTLGIAVKDSAGNLRGVSDVFADFSDVFAKMPDSSEKTTLALKVFGKAGAELIPLLNEGKAGLAGYRSELDKLGGIVTPEAAAQADLFNDQLDYLTMAAKGLAYQVGEDLLPDLIKLTAEFGNNATAGDGVKGTADKIAESIRGIVGAGGAAIDTLQAMTSLYQGMIAKVAEFNASSPLGKALGMDADYYRELSKVGFEDYTAQAKQAKGRWDKPVGVNRPGGPIEFIDPPGPNNDPLAAMRRLLADQDKPTKAARATGGRSGADKALADLDRQLEEVRESALSFNTQLEDLQAELSGPLDQALLQHNRRLKELDDLAKKGEISSDRLRDAKAAETALYERDKKAIEERLDVGGALLKDLQFELDLLSLTNDERTTAIQLRGMDSESIAKYGDQIAEANAKITESQKAISQLDEFRANFEDNVASVLDGTQSIKDAFESLADSVIA